MLLTNDETQQLQTAIALFENPSVAAKLTHLIGSPIEKGFALLFDQVNKIWLQFHKQHC